MYLWYEPAVEFYCRLLTVYKPQFCPVALQSPGPSFSVSLGSLIHLLGSGKMPHPSPWTANQAGDDSLPGSDVTGPPHVRTGGIYTVTRPPTYQICQRCSSHDGQANCAVTCTYMLMGLNS